MNLNSRKISAFRIASDANTAINARNSLDLELVTELLPLAKIVPPRRFRRGIGVGILSWSLVVIGASAEQFAGESFSAPVDQHYG